MWRPPPARQRSGARVLGVKAILAPGSAIPAHFVGLFPGTARPRSDESRPQDALRDLRIYAEFVSALPSGGRGTPPRLREALTRLRNGWSPALRLQLGQYVVQLESLRLVRCIRIFLWFSRSSRDSLGVSASQVAHREKGKLSMNLASYLLIRTPTQPPRLSKGKKDAQPGKVSLRRITLSLVGIVLGIVASFFVTGIRPASPPSASNRSTATSSSEEISRSVGSSTEQPAQPVIQEDWSMKRFLQVGLISLVVCGLTYQGLYFSLRLYEHEPAWLLLFVSFQYGYFWQSAVHFAGSLATTT